MKKYITRKIETELLNSIKDFPVLILTGARQTGKSTLLKHLFPDYKYVTLDYPNIRSFAKEEPELFLEQYGKNVIIDEIQYVPELLQYIKIVVDETRDVNGQFILTGSQYFPLMQGVSESLAGRVAIHNLFGISLEELDLISDDFNLEKTFNLIFQGFFPDTIIHHVKPQSYYSSYIQTYLERDIRQLLAVHNLSLFQNFLELLAARVGSVLNLNEISKECGISFPTAKKWCSILEITQIVYLLRPYYKNISKRVIKSPKLYFMDTGLLSYILRYQTPETLQVGPLSGNLFENLIIIELLKKKNNLGINFELSFFRDSNKNEIDVILEMNGVLRLVEIKKSKNIKKKFGSVLEKILPLMQNSSARVISFDKSNIPISENVSSVFWYDFINDLEAHCKSPIITDFRIIDE